MKEKECNHPAGFDSVRITPEFQDNPDLERLGRALIAAAINIAEKKRAEEKAAQKPPEDEKGNDMA